MMEYVDYENEVVERVITPCARVITKSRRQAFISSDGAIIEEGMQVLTDVYLDVADVIIEDINSRFNDRPNLRERELWYAALDRLEG